MMPLLLISLVIAAANGLPGLFSFWGLVSS
jgi:hypothetical protein